MTRTVSDESSPRATVSAEPIAVALGTRPEIIKLAPIIRRLGDRAWVIHTGQHYDPAMAETFFTGAGLAPPATVLTGVGGASRSAQIATMLAQLDELFAGRRPAAVIVQGDTNTTNAAAQAASYHSIPLVHVEAGLRSYDRAMPEELNRLVVGALADLHCAATAHNADNLRREGVAAERIVVTGNTIVEVVESVLAAGRGVGVRALADVPNGPFVLATIHRPENTDDPDRLRTILEQLADLPVPVVAPLHPRTVAAARRFELDSFLRRLTVLDPVDHAGFLALASAAALLISDSGGVQEECTVIKKPLIVVRNSTERPESIEAGFAQLIPAGPDIGAVARTMLADGQLAARLASTPSPYGTAGAAQRIVDETYRLIGARSSPVP